MLFTDIPIVLTIDIHIQIQLQDVLHNCWEVYYIGVFLFLMRLARAHW